MPVRRASVERAAAVDEHRAAPLRGEVMLELGAGGDDVVRAEAEVAQARPHLAIVVAADAAVAAGVEAQARREVEHGVGERMAEFAAHDQAVVAAEALEPAALRMQ